MLTKIQTTDQNLSLIQDNISTALNFQSNIITVTTSQGSMKVVTSTRNAPFLGGSLVYISLITGQDNLVPHGLGSIPRMWTIAGQDTNTNVWSPTSLALKDTANIARSADERFLNLRCGANCNIAVWIN